MLAATTLLLAQAGTSADQRACEEDAATQAALTDCAVGNWREADTSMEAQWAQTAARMRQRDIIYDHSHEERPGFHAQLLASQQAWRAYRDAHCTAEGYLARGGSLEPMLVAECKAQLTRERTRQLQTIEEWPE